MIADTLNEFNPPESLVNQAIKITASIMADYLYI